MPSDVEELRRLITQIGDELTDLHRKVNVMLRSLQRCQTRCHVENPPGRWRSLGRAIAGMFKFPEKNQPTETADVE